MSKRGQVSFAAPPCPASTPENDHGPLLLIRPGSWYCPNQAHYGKPGEKPTKMFFTDEELRGDSK